MENFGSQHGLHDWLLLFELVLLAPWRLSMSLARLMDSCGLEENIHYHTSTSSRICLLFTRYRDEATGRTLVKFED